ncbi:transmembrane proteins 14C-domain-containing protein [Daldinia sp. FL1419]|nr:transmembrane proteins 14C-domain-containing protein [Daldinia sp. FL1419]
MSHPIGAAAPGPRPLSALTNLLPTTPLIYSKARRASILQLKYSTIPKSSKTEEIMALETIAFALGALTATGGTIGYVKTGSVPSVIAGLTVGILYALGGYRLQSRQSLGIELALLASVVLGGASIPRALRSGKPVPTVLSFISVFGLLTFGNAFRKTL